MDRRPDRLWHARQVIAFERLLFRATRGNMFLRTAAVGAVTDPSTTEQQEKSVYVVFFAGERARTKIMKVSLCRVASHSEACTLWHLAQNLPDLWRLRQGCACLPCRAGKHCQATEVGQ